MSASPNNTTARKAYSPPYVALERLSLVSADQRPTTRVLDVPCGDGVIVAALGLAGFEVTGCDLFPEYAERTLAALARNDGDGILREFWPGPAPRLVRDLLAGHRPMRQPAVAIARGDMGDRLPFPDARFDMALSLEGIEHIDGQERFLRELRRVLKPGGTLLLSTPNTLCLRSRLAYAFAGQRTFRTFMDEYTTVQAREAGRVYHGHVFMLDYFQLRYLLHHTGFRMKRLLRPRYSPTSVLLTPILLPLVALFTRLAQRRSRREFAALKTSGALPADTPAPYREIIRHALSPALMWGTVLVVEAEAC